MNLPLAPAADPRSVRLLLVEDDPAYVQLVETWLEFRKTSLAIELEVVGTLAEAVTRLDAGHDVDVVALDLLLPDVRATSPFTGLSRIVETTPSTPVVVITIHDRELGIEASRLGAADFAVKAGETDGLEALVATLHQALVRAERHRARDEALASARSQNARMQRLARVLAHDLRTPIAVAMTAVETASLLLERAQPAQASLQLEMAHRRLGDTVAHFEQILDETLRDTQTSFAVDVMETAEVAYASLAESERDHLQLMTQPGPSVLALPGSMRQVLSNLLTNCVSHNPDRRVNVWVRGPDATARSRCMSTTTATGGPRTLHSCSRTADRPPGARASASRRSRWPSEPWAARSASAARHWAVQA